MRTDCPDCGNPFVSHSGTFRTLVGHGGPEPCGRVHDDNCAHRWYQCANGHKHAFSRRNRCDKCGWVGKDECFCDNGKKKVDEWPDDDGYVMDRPNMRFVKEPQ